MNPILALIIANIIWGAAAPIFKFALGNVPPFTLAFSRFFLAALICIPFLPRSPFKKITGRDWRSLILAATFGISLNISFFFLGLEKTESINAPIIASSAPLFLFGLSIVCLKEKFKAKTFFGMFVSLVGVLWIIFAPIVLEGKTANADTAVQGNLYLIAATLVSIFMPIFLNSPLKRINLYTVTFITFFVGALSFLPFSVNELQHWSITQLNQAGLIGILYGAIFSSVAAYVLYYHGLSKIPVHEAGLFSYIDPVASILIAVPLLGEYPTTSFWLGVVLVFGGIFISEGRLHYHPIHKLIKS